MVYCVCGMSKDSPIALFSCVYKKVESCWKERDDPRTLLGRHTHTLKAQAKGIKRLCERYVILLRI